MSLYLLLERDEINALRAANSVGASASMSTGLLVIGCPRPGGQIVVVTTGVYPAAEQGSPQTYPWQTRETVGTSVGRSRAGAGARPGAGQAPKRSPRLPATQRLSPIPRTVVAMDMRPAHLP